MSKQSKRSTPLKCECCGEMSYAGVSLKCSMLNCNRQYKYSCLGLTDAEFKSWTPAKKKDWVCPSCKCNKPKVGDNSSTPVGKLSVQQPDDVIITMRGEGMAAITTVTSDLAEQEGLPDWFSKLEISLTNRMRSMIVTEFSDLKQINKEILDGMNFLSGKYDDIHEKFVTVSDAVTTLQKENSELKKIVDKLQHDADANEQKGRLCNVEIQNVPFIKGENLFHVLESLGKSIGVPLSRDVIRSVHRVPHNQTSDRPKNIIAELANRYLRDDVIAAARVRRGLTTENIGIGSPSNKKPIFINEHLTLKNKILYSKARELAKAKGYRFVWVKNGNILMRKSDDGRVVSIRDNSDLDRLP